jgi:hypothetical protein
MVAFELAQIFEKAGDTPEAVRWFTTAVERFRRPQWKQKAEEGLARLGAPIPASAEAAPIVAVSESTAEPTSALAPIIAEFSEEQPSEIEEVMNEGQQESVFEQPAAASAAPTAPAEGATEHRGRRRRGRRGGRGRHKGGQAAAPALNPAPAVLAPPPSMFDRFMEQSPGPSARAAASSEAAEPRLREAEPSSARSHEAGAASYAPSRVRSGDPALSSRMVQLESQLRRLLACSLRGLDDSDEAPAGPGVFLISDTDQTTYYYAEACQTLRVGIANMLRSGRGSREGGNVKERLAEHLGINEARVGKYLKDHCGVRWLQLDEGAPLLAHFAIAVLRPISNE